MVQNSSKRRCGHTGTDHTLGAMPTCELKATGSITATVVANQQSKGSGSSTTLTDMREDVSL